MKKLLLLMAAFSATANNGIRAMDYGIEKKEATASTTMPINDVLTNLIFKAVKDGNERAILQLLEKNKGYALVKDNKRCTPLHYTNSITIAEKLIECAADIRAESVDNITPLHMIDDLETANLLIAMGAHITAKSRRGLTPLEFKIWFTNPKLIQLLFDLTLEQCVEKTKKTFSITAESKANKPYQEILCDYLDELDDLSNNNLLTNSSILHPFKYHLERIYALKSKESCLDWIKKIEPLIIDMRSIAEDRLISIEKELTHTILNKNQTKPSDPKALKSSEVNLKYFMNEIRCIDTVLNRIKEDFFYLDHPIEALKQTGKKKPGKKKLIPTEKQEQKTTPTPIEIDEQITPPIDELNDEFINRWAKNILHRGKTTAKSFKEPVKINPLECKESNIITFYRNNNTSSHGAAFDRVTNWLTENRQEELDKPEYRKWETEGLIWSHGFSPMVSSFIGSLSAIKKSPIKNDINKAFDYIYHLPAYIIEYSGENNKTITPEKVIFDFITTQKNNESFFSIKHANCRKLSQSKYANELKDDEASLDLLNKTIKIDISIDAQRMPNTIEALKTDMKNKKIHSRVNISRSNQKFGDRQYVNIEELYTNANGNTLFRDIFIPFDALNATEVDKLIK